MGSGEAAPGARGPPRAAGSPAARTGGPPPLAALGGRAQAQRSLRGAAHRALHEGRAGDAAFFAERLAALDPSEASAILLARCYHRQGRLCRAIAALKGTASDEGRHLLALCCLEAGQLAEAEQALSNGTTGEPPLGAAGHFLFGLVCKRSGHPMKAIDHFHRSLALDPLQWQAYEELCQLGADEQVLSLLDANREEVAGLDLPEFLPKGTAAGWAEGGSDMETENVDPLLTAPHASLRPPGLVIAEAMLTDGGGGGGAGGLATPHEGFQPPLHTPPSSSFETPPAQGTGFMLPQAPKLPNAPRGERGYGAGAAADAYGADKGADGAVSPGSIENGGAAQKRKIHEDSKLRKTRLSFSETTLTPPRRSARLSNVSQEPSTTGKGQLKAAEKGAGKYAARRAGLAHGAAEEEAGEDTSLGDLIVMQLLRVLVSGYHSLCAYKCEAAIDAFHRLPPEQFATGWVLCQVGKAYFELVNYPEAARHFEWARRIDRTRLEGMEIFSTVLWHMKKETELAYLAHEALAIDRLCPQTWCVLGNCMSLQKEHESALKFFQRALQLSPAFTYAHTLCGHEYVANEDFEKGLNCYRSAIRLDTRHYNAWYGIGQINFQQEKYDLADYHFRRAAKINPKSSVLFCCLGRALHKRGQPSEALHYLQSAIQKDPSNPLAKFEKASVLFSQECFAEAKKELEALLRLAPREPNVYFLLGKVCKRMGETNAALKNFYIALDLRPSSRDINTIKSAVEKIKLVDDSDEEDFEF